MLKKIPTAIQLNIQVGLLFLISNNKVFTFLLEDKSGPTNFNNPLRVSKTFSKNHFLKAIQVLVIRDSQWKYDFLIDITFITRGLEEMEISLNLFYSSLNLFELLEAISLRAPLWA